MTPDHVKTFGYLLGMGLAQRITWPILPEQLLKESMQSLHHTASNKKHYSSQ